ncbi:unnamed protein product [Heligmosomoides polygyrus]|uniref:RUN domain-containing protein n=1 Tax=Heligmosomoides polygyrus TaxID=6339 RepID=A0A183FGH2_HELPZ|nr:unnamed protein product [Heligmosomoides polygyrus]
MGFRILAHKNATSNANEIGGFIQPLASKAANRSRMVHTAVLSCVQSCGGNPALACRLTGKHGKDATLRDLLEDIVNFMIGASLVIDFILDAIGLGHEDIELDFEHFLTQPSLFWCKLDDNDADRGRVLKELRSSRIEWTSLIRGAIGRALTDVRSYRYRAEDNTLVPSNVSATFHDMMGCEVNMANDLAPELDKGLLGELSTALTKS